MKIINLLPRIKQQELRYEELFHSVLTAAIFGFVSLVLVVLLKVGLGVYLQQQQTAVAAQIEQTKSLSNKEENAKLKSTIDNINLQLKDYQDLSNASPLWSNALRFFAADVPDQVKITTFVADSAKKQVDIGGFAPTREQVIALYNKINEDKEHFRDIDYPLENVARATDVDFHFTFFVQDSVLKPEGAAK
jgi:Tfp pilus assembly protein PilN